MKKLISFFTLVLLTSTAFATSDGHDRVYLVVKNVMTEEFFVERAPIIGCYGLVRGPHLVQLTSEYKAPSNIGCGAEPVLENINYLVCAKVTASKESDDYMSFSEITLDISKCDAKNDPKFLNVLQAAAKLNFPLKKGEVKLTLIK